MEAGQPLDRQIKHQTLKQDEYEVDKLMFWHCAHPSYTHSTFKSIARGATLHILMSLKQHHLQEVKAFLLLLLLVLMTLSDSVFSLLWGGMQKWRDLCVSQHMCLSLRFYRTPLWDRWDHCIFLSSFFLCSILCSFPPALLPLIPPLALSFPCYPIMSPLALPFYLVSAAISQLSESTTFTDQPFISCYHGFPGM